MFSPHFTDFLFNLGILRTFFLTFCSTVFSRTFVTGFIYFNKILRNVLEFLRYLYCVRFILDILCVPFLVITNTDYHYRSLNFPLTIRYILYRTQVYFDQWYPNFFKTDSIQTLWCPIL